MGEAGKPVLFECFHACCPVVLRGRRGSFWHSNLCDNVWKMSKLEEVSHEMLVFLHPRVSFRVSGCPVASPCLWGKLGNLTFSNVSKQVVLSFCVAGVAVSDIPTCVITCGKCQNWRKSRTKCSFFCTHVSRFESLVVLWRRRVYGGSWKTLPFRMFPSRLSYSSHFTLYTAHSTLHTLHSTLPCTLHSTLHTLHFTLSISRSWLYTPHFTLHTFHSTLHTPHFTLLGGGVVTLVVRVVMFYWLGFVRFRLCSASRFWSTYRDADVRSAGLNSFPGFISLLGAAATHCPGSRQTSSQACILCGCLYSMLFIVYVELEAWDLQHSRALIVCGHVNEGRVCLSLSLL